MRSAMAIAAESFQEACAALEATLAGGSRSAIVAEFSKSRSFDRAARRLRDSMRTHRFEGGELKVPSQRWAARFDQLTRQDGFHALQDWDGKADRFNHDIIPVEVASLAERIHRPKDHAAGSVALSIILDYYFAHLLGLLALRAWDDGDPSANLGTVNLLLGHLQGPQGSGQAFGRHALGLIVIATSHFEPDVTAYDHLLAKVRRLNPDHRLKLATVHAAILGCHLRFGLEVTCAGDVRALREDNVPDYPWLLEAVATLLDAYATAKASGDAEGRVRISEPILLALMPDPEALLGKDPPDSLGASEAHRKKVREIFASHRQDLLLDFETHRPREDAYSPFSFTFNFPHNLVKGIVVDAAFRGAPWKVTLDDLVTALPKGGALDLARRSLATTLMGYALASPDTIRGRPHPAIVCDPKAGQSAFEGILSRLARINLAP
jgi:hypothetical protein